MKEDIKLKEHLAPEQVLLSEVLDRVLNTGVAVSGDLVLRVADVDLVYCGLRLLLSSVDRLETLHSEE